MMSPLKISILIHYYCSDGDYPHNSPAVKEALEEFVRVGVLYQNSDGKPHIGEPMYSANRSALEVYIDAITNIPLPKQKWVIESNKSCKAVQE